MMVLFVVKYVCHELSCHNGGLESVSAYRGMWRDEHRLEAWEANQMLQSGAAVRREVHKALLLQKFISTYL